MAELVKVVVDVMGGDYAPVEPVKAAVEAVKERDDIQVILTGIEDDGPQESLINIRIIRRTGFRW